MPRFADVDVKQIPGSSFEYSAIRPEKLGATEYTLVTIAVDKSSSVYNFKNELLDMLKEVIAACQKNPRSENMMVRLVLFNQNLKEVHGFIPLADINVNDYDDIDPSGSTALFDTVYSSIGATNDYSKTLIDQDFEVNGAVYIITDGMDNESIYTTIGIKQLIANSRKEEVIESLITVLIGIDTASCGQYLQNFKDEAELSHYIDMGDVSAGKLAKLGGWISKSISSQSQSLGSGGPSQQTSLTF
jgi:uncharacterized protein YegL